MGFHGADRKSGFLIWQELSFYSFTGNINRRLETHGSASLQKNHFSVLLGIGLCFRFHQTVFNENILDFRYPTLEIEKAFGPWPIYVIVNIALAILCYKIIDIITKKLVLIQN